MGKTKAEWETIRQKTALKIRNEILSLLPKMIRADDTEFYHLLNQLDENSEMYKRVKHKIYK